MCTSSATKFTTLVSARVSVASANLAPQLHARPLEASQTGQRLSPTRQPSLLVARGLPAAAALVPSFHGKPISNSSAPVLRCCSARSRSIWARFRRRAAAVSVTFAGVAKSCLGCVQRGRSAHHTRGAAPALDGERLLLASRGMLAVGSRRNEQR